MSQPSRIEILSLDTKLIPYLGNKLVEIKQKSLEQFINALVIVPSRKAVKELKQYLANSCNKNTTILPKIYAINDLDALIPAQKHPAISNQMQLGIAVKILKSMELGYHGQPYIHSYIHLAKEIITLFDSLATNEISLDKFSDIVPENLSEYWQLTSDFLYEFHEKLLQETKGKHLYSQAKSQVETLKSLSSMLQEQQPQHLVTQNLVICAGIDGFIPAAKALIETIADLPNGTVILAGYVNSSIAESNKPDHPNHLINMLITDAVQLPQAHSNNAVVTSNIMSDEPFSNRDLSDKISFQNLELLPAENQEQEALNVALLCRKNLETQGFVTAVVTPDADLSTKIQAILERWGIVVDLASGTPLAKTVRGNFVLRTAHITADKSDSLALLSILKHPLAKLGFESSLHLKNKVRRYEHYQIRSDNISPKDDSNEIQEKFYDAVSDFTKLQYSGETELATWITEHIKLIENLSKDDSGDLDIWTNDEGQQIANCLLDLLNLSSSFPKLKYSEYLQVLQLTLMQETLRSPISHPRIKILNPIQGAHLRFDSVILCGLNEGTWPKKSPHNIWLNRQMSMAIGLPDDRILNGRAGQIFAQNMTSDKVYLSYSKRKNGTAIDPSRWVLKLQALAVAIQKEDNLYNKTPIAFWREKLNWIEQRTHINQPNPTPATKHRPKIFTVSELETLFKDPYQIYAKKILKLRPLNDVTAIISQADYGSWVHKFLEVATLEDRLEPTDLCEFANSILPVDLPQSTQKIWLESFTQFVSWLSDYLLSRKITTQTTLVEHKMTAALKIADNEFQIIGKADRIDLLQDGTYELIDYKTGYTPTKAEVKEMISPQLALLAHLFEATNPGKKIAKLTYVSLGNQEILSFAADELVANTYAKTHEALEWFFEESNPYFVNPVVSIKDRFNPYLHLERTQEWLERKMVGNNG